VDVWPIVKAANMASAADSALRQKRKPMPPAIIVGVDHARQNRWNDRRDATEQ
jgi:hypothetical protein